MISSHRDFDFPVFEEGDTEIPPEASNMLFLFAVIITATIIFLLFVLAYYAYCWQEKAGRAHIRLEGIPVQEVSLEKYPFHFNEIVSDEADIAIESEINTL